MEKEIIVSEGTSLEEKREVLAGLWSADLTEIPKDGSMLLILDCNELAIARFDTLTDAGGFWCNRLGERYWIKYYLCSLRTVTHWMPIVLPKKEKE